MRLLPIGVQSSAVWLAIAFAVSRSRTTPAVIWL